MIAINFYAFYALKKFDGFKKGFFHLFPISVFLVLTKVYYILDNILSFSI